LINGECMPCTNERADRADVAALRSRLSAAEAERDVARVERVEMRAMLAGLADACDDGDVADDCGCELCGEPGHVEGCPVPEARALLARPATVATARAREALAALEYARADFTFALSRNEDNYAAMTASLGVWRAAESARLSAEKEAADAEAK